MSMQVEFRSGGRANSDCRRQSLERIERIERRAGSRMGPSERFGLLRDWRAGYAPDAIRLILLSRAGRRTRPAREHYE